MGDVTLLAFGLLALVGLLLVGFGTTRRSRLLLVLGGALLLALVGAWIVGPPAAAIGLVPFAFLRRRRGKLPARGNRTGAIR